MQHALRVRGRQAGAQLAGDVDDLLGRQPADAPEQRREVLAAHELHREEDLAVGLADVEDPADRRMRDLPRESHFVEDALARLGARRVDQLQRDRRLEHEVVGAPDVAHAAAADPRDHPVAAGEHVAGRERRAAVGVRSRSAARLPSLVVKRAAATRPPAAGRASSPQASARNALGARPAALERGEKQLLRALVQRRHWLREYELYSSSTCRRLVTRDRHWRPSRCGVCRPVCRVNEA